MAFFGPSCANAYGPHNGIFSIALQRKCMGSYSPYDNNLFLIAEK